MSTEIVVTVPPFAASKLIMRGLLTATSGFWLENNTGLIRMA